MSERHKAELTEFCYECRVLSVAGRVCQLSTNLLTRSIILLQHGSIKQHYILANLVKQYKWLQFHHT